MKAVLEVTGVLTGVVTELVIGVRIELVSGVWVETPYIVFSSFVRLSLLSLFLFKLVEVSISFGRSFFFFFFLCLTSDDSVNAGGLDVTAAVAFAVVTSAIASVVVVVALFWGGWNFLPLQITWVQTSLSG